MSTDSTSTSLFNELSRYDPGKLVAGKHRALLVLDRNFFTTPNNCQNNNAINTYLKNHRCILWSIKSSYVEDETLGSLPFINGQIIGLIENAKNMVYIRNLVRANKDILALPSILIDIDLNRYQHSGFDYTIDLNNYFTTGFIKAINIIKLFEDLDAFLEMWYDPSHIFHEQAAAGIIIKNTPKLFDYNM